MSREDDTLARRHSSSRSMDVSVSYTLREPDSADPRRYVQAFRGCQAVVGLAALDESSVEDSMEFQCRGHKRGDVEDTEAPDDNGRNHSSSEPNDHVRMDQAFLASTQLRVTPHP